MMNYTEKLIMLHEGKMYKPYFDSVGKLTIGVGRNLDDKGLSEDEIQYLFHNDVEEVREILKNLDWYHRLYEPRKAVVINMMFNLGRTGFFQFRKMIHALEEGDYEKAVSLIKDGISLIPESSDLYYRATAYLVSGGKYQEAFTYLENALILDFEKHEVLFEFFPKLETQKALFKIIDQYRSKN